MEKIHNLSPNKQCHLVAMPFPGRGYINPMLHLCKLLVSNSTHITVSFVLTPEWLRFLTAEEPPPPPNIQYVTLPQVVPSEIGRANDIEGFIKATLTNMEEPFERLLDELNPLPTVVIYDTYMYWVVGIGDRRNIPVVSFFPMSASVFTVFYHFDLLRRHGHFPLDVSGWNDEVKQAIKNKRECYRRLGKDRTTEAFEKYKEARQEAKNAVKDARAKVNEDLYAKLDTKEGERHLPISSPEGQANT